MNTIPSQTEKEITKAIRQLLKTVGCFHWKAMQGLGSTPGVSDILGVWNGRFLAIEIKKAKGKLSPPQENFIKQINARGGLAFCARSVDDVIENMGLKDRFLF